MSRTVGYLGLPRQFVSNTLVGERRRLAAERRQNGAPPSSLFCLPPSHYSSSRRRSVLSGQRRQGHGFDNVGRQMICMLATQDLCLCRSPPRWVARQSLVCRNPFLRGLEDGKVVILTGFMTRAAGECVYHLDRGVHSWRADEALFGLTSGLGRLASPMAGKPPRPHLLLLGKPRRCVPVLLKVRTVPRSSPYSSAGEGAHDVAGGSPSPWAPGRSIEGARSKRKLPACSLIVVPAASADRHIKTITDADQAMYARPTRSPTTAERILAWL